ncbi:MAG TPA: hypothetical protein VKV95_07315 [Terriglobia bacterium]|nr:hypothetical protein [Terriglobia bacterium]
MFKSFFHSFQWTLPAVWLACTGISQPLMAAMAAASRAGSESEAAFNWQSPARLHHGLRTVRGTLIFNSKGVEFNSEKHFSHRWPFVEIQTFELSPHRFLLTGYENRSKYLPGDRQFRFDLTSDVSPVVAAELARRVAKPVKNDEPDPNVAGYATLPARHTSRAGGSNGVLRFTDDGIDYMTAFKQDARRWRWADIQILANPDAYHFRVGAYRETFEFELKEPMAKELFEKLWDYVYGRDLDIKPLNGGSHQ